MKLLTIKGSNIPENLRTLPVVDELKSLIQRGFIVIDKPAGMTSHDVVDRIRKIYGIRKVGHAGTLDPMVTGVLPIGIGEGTKLLRFLLESGKVYLCEMLVHKDIEAELIEKSLHEQIGVITQLPPVKSRVKRVERDREIYSLDIKSITKRKAIFEVYCEAGTYIRKLCHDVGEQLGIGANMHKLQRLSAGGFKIDEAITLDELEKAKATDAKSVLKYLRPLEVMVAHKPKIWITDGASRTVSQGAKLAAPGIIAFEKFSENDFVFLYRADGSLVAVALAEISSDEAQEINRGIVAVPHKIIKNP
ncbi:MAG: RNA-guided pseudouridylation complex pseudouridine synthase subunit Cbf5 [Planctomycetes bacterium]|nr:RNA-guided pseudouridylation complex pseudouridine synthase subunit Cbf5 [Planctomycetota bacterium]